VRNILMNTDIVMSYEISKSIHENTIFLRNSYISFQYYSIEKSKKQDHCHIFYKFFDEEN